MPQLRRVSGDKIRQARLRRGWTQNDLARAVGTRERQIVRWENDQHAPRLETALTIAHELGVTLAELCSGDADDDEEDADMPTARECELLEALRPLVRLLARQEASV